MTTLLSEGFEGAALPAGWTIRTPTGKASTWAVGIPNASANAPPSAYSGSYVLATNPTGNHAIGEESVVDVELPDLTHYEAAAVTWAGWLDLVNSSGCGAQVHVSTDGGASFVGVAGAHLSPTYNTSATTGGGVILGTIDRWTGTSPGTWTVRTLDLEAALGASPRDQVVLRFAFEARDGFAGRAGWYIDAFELTADPVESDPPEVTVTSPTTTTTAAYTLAGTATDAGTGLDVVEVAHNGGAWVEASGTSAWSLAVELEEDLNTFQVRASDLLGNETTVDFAVVYHPEGLPELDASPLTAAWDASLWASDPWASDAGLVDEAVLAALFTDARAEEDDQVPAGDDDRRGFWGDTLTGETIGSRLWLLERASLTPETARLATSYASEALQRLVARAVLEAFEAEATIETTAAGPSLVLAVTYRAAGDVEREARFTISGAGALEA